MAVGCIFAITGVLMLSCNMFADRYVAHIKNDSSLRSGESNHLPVHENEFLSNLNSYGNEPSLNDETPPSSSPTEPTRPEKSSRDGLKNFNGSVYAPKELI
ncbi:hypothetical protein Dimus_030675 [Dionaea muscipula]